jgi:small subunit ribosomal protein S2
MTFSPGYLIKDLIESYVHFGHKKNNWNNKMQSFIYGINDNIHIIDLKKTAISLCNALQMIFNIAANHGNILFINTKKQSADITKNAAIKCRQYYVSHRWLGGMLTNWQTISKSIETMVYYDQLLAKKALNYTKKEILNCRKRRAKISKALEGVKNLAGKVNAIFMVDAKFHSIAVEEAKKMNIPIISIVDTNASPKGINSIIPGNDESRKSISIYCELVASIIIAGSKAIKYKKHDVKN